MYNRQATLIYDTTRTTLIFFLLTTMITVIQDFSTFKTLINETNLFNVNTTQCTGAVSTHEY
jgi:hypothetical protein